MTGELWQCERQRAGPLVKEKRWLWECKRPHMDPLEQAEYNHIRAVRSSFRRESAHRLELYLACFGYSGSHYVLSFMDEALPQNYTEAKRAVQNFLLRLKRWQEKKGRPKGVKCAYAVESLSAYCRYHIHMVLDDNEVTPAEVRYLWRLGGVTDVPLLKWSYNYAGRVYKGYYGLARYFNKERPDGYFLPLNRHRWGVTRPLRLALPEAERWEDTGGAIKIPEGATVLQYEPMGGNQFGRYALAAYMLPEALWL